MCVKFVAFYKKNMDSDQESLDLLADWEGPEIEYDSADRCLLIRSCPVTIQWLFSCLALQLLKKSRYRSV